MSRQEEAIEVLKRVIPYTSEFADARNIAIRSLEAWDKVKEDLSGDFTEQTQGFRYGIAYAMVIIDKHLKEVEE